MKKKITAVLLTLCMVLSLLPLSALAAAWKVTLNGQEVTLTENEDGSITSEPDQSSYYTFKKVQDQDVFQYYTFEGVYIGQLTGTPVVVEQECTCDTKCDPSSPNPDCPVCSAQDADVDAVCKGAETAVEEDTVTVTAPVEEGKVETEVTVTDEQAGDMVSAAAEGVVTVKVETAGDTDVNEMAVTLPKNLLDEAKKTDNSVSAVRVDTEVAVVDLPVAALETTANVTLTMTRVTAGATVLGGVSLDLSANGSAVSTFDVPVFVSINVEVSAATNPMVAYLNGGRYFHVRQWRGGEGSFDFLTRHFSDFVVVDGDAVKLEANEMQNTGSGRNHVYAIEADEALVAAVKASDGSLNYMSVGPLAEEMQEKTVNAAVNAPDSELDNICAVIGEVTLNGDGTPDIEDAVRIAADFADEIL